MDWTECFKTCWLWDLQRELFSDNPEIQKRITAAQKTYGIWSHLPKRILDELENY